MLKFFAACSFAVLSICAQSPDSALTFEAAAIKPAPPPTDGRMMVGIQGGPESSSPGQMNFWNISLGELIQNAWDVKSFQISGPDWLQQVRFDIQAKVPAGATKAQGKIMLQNLLAGRFRLVLHKSTKESSIYGLLVAKNGPKLKDAETNANAKPARRMVTAGPGGKMKMAVNGATMSQFIDMLGLQLDRPVVDMTGLTGTYNITLEFAPDPAIMAARMGAAGMPPPPASEAADPNGATIFSALTEQLGLRLDSRKGPIVTLIIDSAQKTPVEN